MIKKFKNVREKQIFIVRTVVVIAVFFVLAFIADRKISPAIEQTARYNAMIHATEAINSAVYNELAHTEYTYASFVNLSQDETGTVTALETDVVGINRLKSKIFNRLIEDFDALSVEEFKIPAGSLMKSNFLSGRGPDLTFRVLYTGNIEIAFSNHFESAGINQTRHQIIMNISMDVTAVLAGRTITVTVPSSFYLANTVIVGQVPDSFTEVNGDQQKLIPQINDYKS